MVGALVAAVVGIVTLGKRFLSIPAVIAPSPAHRSVDLQFLNGWDVPPSWFGPYLNTFGNIALFIPLGMTLLIFGQTSTRLRLGVGGTIMVGLVCSLGIEIAQYAFALGYTDIDDVVFNTLGAALGAGMTARRTVDTKFRVLRRLALLAAAALTVLLAGLVLWRA